MLLDEHQRPFVAVHVCWSDHEAEVVTSVLREYGIEARVNSEVPHSVLPVTADGLGKVEVLVRQPGADESRAILARYDRDAAPE